MILKFSTTLLGNKATICGTIGNQISFCLSTNLPHNFDRDIGAPETLPASILMANKWFSMVKNIDLVAFCGISAFQIFSA